MSVQNENVNITIYKLPKKLRFGETAVADMTHAYMPKDFYDEFELNENTVFARKNGVFVAMISDGKLAFKPFDQNSADGIHKYKNFPDSCKLKGEFDLCRFGGDYHIYITELSDADKETYEQFKERILTNTASFSKDGRVTYKTNSGEITASYDGDFLVDGIPAEKEYSRYDSKFCKSERKAESLTINSPNHKLFLDFKNIKREEL